jgi:hypothetical protein
MRRSFLTCLAGLNAPRSLPIPFFDRFVLSAGFVTLRQLLFVESMVEKTAAFRHRRAADTARWRERLNRGAAVYPVEVDGTTFDLLERFGGLKDSNISDRQAVATALGKLLRRALEALMREEDASRR